jgi:hypothetical protein
MQFQPLHSSSIVIFVATKNILSWLPTVAHLHAQGKSVRELDLDKPGPA